MNAPFELFVAARYLVAKRRQAVISLVTAISVVGVAAGVTALIVALAINNGFRSTLQRSLLGATAHVTLLEKEPSTGISGWRERTARLARLPGVTVATPALYGEAFLRGPVRAAGAHIKGVPLDSVTLRDLRPLLKQGSLEDLTQARGRPGIVLGSKLAEATGMLLGSVITVISPQGELSPFGMRPNYESFRVTGIFESGFYDLDNGFAFTTLENAQRLFSTGDVVNAIELKVAELDRAPQVAREAEAAAGGDLGATHWMEQNRQLLNALGMEKTVSVVTIGLIQLVAALNILIALVMGVMEKQRDIALLMAMGARERQIRRVFMLQGLLIGATGAAIGLVAGHLLCYFGERYHWIPLDEAIYSLTYVPFDSRWTDSIWVAATALAVSFLATLYPARAAARVVPVETLRYE